MAGIYPHLLPILACKDRVFPRVPAIADAFTSPFAPLCSFLRFVPSSIELGYPFMGDQMAPVAETFQQQRVRSISCLP